MGLSPRGNGCGIFEESGRNFNRTKSSLSFRGMEASPQWNAIVETTLYQATFPDMNRTHCGSSKEKIHLLRDRW